MAAIRCAVCSKFVKAENQTQLSDRIAKALGVEEAQACPHCSGKSEDEILSVLEAKGKISNLNTNEEDVTMDENQAVVEVVEDTMVQDSVVEDTPVVVDEAPSTGVQDTTDEAPVEDKPTMDYHALGITWLTPINRKGITNFQVIPVLKVAVDDGDKDTVARVKANFPDVYESSLKYIGSKRVAKLDEWAKEELVAQAS